MTDDILLALIGFAFVSSITPGPNNLMIMASGANFGVARSLPHALGISLGFGGMIALVGLGLAQMFEVWPGLRLTLAAVSVAYLVWLAWKIATAAPPDAGRTDTRPLTFLQAAAFQWVNPKAWTMALTAVTLYAATGSLAVLAVAAVFTIVNLPAISCWMFLGTQMRRLLTSRRRLRAFNWTMAALLLASVWPSIGPLLS